MEGQLVGRDRLLRDLGRAIGAERSLLVVGEAGIGKTTLVRAALADSGRTWLECAGYATLDWLPYLCFRRALGGRLDGDPTTVAEVIEGAVGPDVLFVDDAQWLDSASIAVLARLVGRTQMLIAARTGAFERIAVDRIEVKPLIASAASRLVSRLRPDLGRAVVRRIVADAGGNPLILEELAGGHAASAPAAHTLLERIDLMPRDARHLVRLLAVASRPLPRARLSRGSRTALASGLVLVGPHGLEIRHAMLAAVIRDAMDPGDLARMHREVAELVDDPGEAARHLLAAGDGPSAAARATAALETVAGDRERAALLVLASQGEPRSAARRIAAARALDALADWPAVLAVLDGHVGAESEALRAHAAYALGQFDDARAALERAGRLVETGDAAARLAWETAAFMVNVDGQVAEAIAFLDGQLVGQPGDAPPGTTLAGLRDSIALLSGLPVDTARIRAALDDALAARSLARATDLARVMNVALLMWRGAEPALEFLNEEGPKFEAAAASDAALEFLAEAVQAHVLAGTFADAVLAADGLIERPAPARAAQMAAIFRASALGLLGRLDQADDALRSLDSSVTADWFGRGEWLANRAQVALLSGQPAVAADLVSQTRAIPSPLVGGHVLPMLTGAWAAVERGLSFEPAASPIRSLAGAAPEFDALRALLEDRPGVAADRFAEAAALWQGFNEVRALVCGWAEGEALRRAGAAAATRTLTSALHRADRAGFEPIAGRIRRSLRLAGVRVAVRPRRKTTLYRLTPRESELLELVGRGHTNIEIARRMGLGRPTVVRILSNAMLKLGASSRAQAVAIAARSTDGAGGARPASEEMGTLIALLAGGMTLGQAANELGLSRRTADRRLAEARVVLGARRTTEAVVLARQAGWFE